MEKAREVLKGEMEGQKKAGNQPPEARHVQPGVRSVSGEVCGRLFPVHLVVSKAGSGGEYAEVPRLAPGILPSFLISFPDATLISFQCVLHGTA